MTEVWLAIIAAVVTIFGGIVTIALAIISSSQRETSRHQRLSALRLGKARKEIKTGDEATGVKLDDAADKLAEVAVVVGETHKLVNSKMGQTLETNLVLAKQNAELLRAAVPVSHQDVQAAEKKVEKAQDELDEHNVQQASVDAAAAERKEPKP